MGDSLGFIIFSSFEGIGIYFLMMAMFRLKPVKHFKWFFPVLVIMVLQSLILRGEVHLPYVTPIVSVLLFVFFLATFNKLPLIWSFIVTLAGYTAFSVIQWGLLTLILGSPEILQETTANGYILQCATTILELAIAAVLLRYRIGFIADFEKLKIPDEKYITIAFIVATMIGLGLVAISIYAMFIVLTSFIYFLYFAFEKEREEE